MSRFFLNTARLPWSRRAFAAGTAATGLGLAAATTIDASGDGLHPPEQAWSHLGFFSSYDHAAIRRGHQVYTEVCATCHGLSRVAFRNLIGVAYTEDEVKAMAEEVEYPGDPDGEGAPTTRPGKPTDTFPAPYQNEQEARAANNGGLPPDLSLITKARHGGPDYVYAILTGYRDPPAGMEVEFPQHYNPYMAGGKIAMIPPLSDEQVEYEDGTPATVSQMAKDVATFLSWAAEPEMEERKRTGLKTIMLLTIGMVTAGVVSRVRWSQLKNRRIDFSALTKSL